MQNKAIWIILRHSSLTSSGKIVFIFQLNVATIVLRHGETKGRKSAAPPSSSGQSGGRGRSSSAWRGEFEKTQFARLACTPNGHVNLNVLRTRTKSRSGRTRPTRALAKVHRRHREREAWEYAARAGGRREIRIHVASPPLANALTLFSRSWHSAHCMVFCYFGVCAVIPLEKNIPRVCVCGSFFSPFAAVYIDMRRAQVDGNECAPSVRTEAKATRSFLITIQNVALCH
jgi:hypothetical protein